MDQPSIIPPEVLPVTSAWIRKVCAGVTGRVLDLGGGHGGLDQVEDVDVVTLDRLQIPPADGFGGRHFDAIVSIARFPLVADLPGFLGALLVHLASDGTFGIVEPVWRPGWARMARASLRRDPTTAALHLDRDVVAAMWAAGLSTRWLDRWELPESVPGFDPFVVAEFRRRRA